MIELPVVSTETTEWQEFPNAMKLPKTTTTRLAGND
jgi:hypothetical protein